MSIQVTQGTGTFVATFDTGGGVQSPCMNLIDPVGVSIYGSAGSASGSILSIQGVAGGTPAPISGSVTVTGTTTVTGAVTISGTPTVTVSGTATVSGPVTQSGTWTVQPGNTPNTAPWLVTLASGTTAAIGTTTSLQGGTWTVGLSAGTNAIGTATSLQGGTWTVQPGNTPNTVAWLVQPNSTATVGLNAGSQIIGNVRVDQTTPGNTNAISIAQLGTTTVVTAGLQGTLAIGGASASNTAITTNPVNQGAQAVSSENSTATTGRMVQLVADLVGKLIVLPYSNPENFVSGVTPSITGTQTVLLISAPAATLRNYITSLSVTNAVNIGTVVSLKDGTSGTSIWSGYCGTQTAGRLQITFPTPLRQPTAGTALNCFCVTTAASVIVSAQGYKGV